jgi:hypothetical protein
MDTDLLKKIKALRHMTGGELRDRYIEAFGEAARSTNRVFLQKRIAWRLQANAFGGLAERARRRAEELANDADLRTRAPRGAVEAAIPEARTVERPFRSKARNDHLLPGTILTREYQGNLVQVTVLERGFEYGGEVFRSLSAVAHAVTGSHWSGNYFFGLDRKEA